MNKITTPFGEIDLDIDPISFWINDSSIGARQLVTYEGIRSKTERGQFAQIVWIIDQYDKEGNKLNELHAVQGRQVITPVSGQNRVTAEGILIVREAFPEGEIGDRAYEMSRAKGYNEYAYWMALLRIAKLPDVIIAAGNLLAQYERYNRP